MVIEADNVTVTGQTATKGHLPRKARLCTEKLDGLADHGFAERHGALEGFYDLIRSLDDDTPENVALFCDADGSSRADLLL